MCDGITPRDCIEDQKKSDNYGTYERRASEVKADVQVSSEEKEKIVKKHWLPNWRNLLRCD